MESSADVRVNRKMLIGSNLHFMATSMDDRMLDNSRVLLLLPMGEGQMHIPSGGRWKKPVVLVGEFAGAQWKQFERFEPEDHEGELALPISTDRSLGVMILCDAADQTAAVRQMDSFVREPWSLTALGKP